MSSDNQVAKLAKTSEQETVGCQFKLYLDKSGLQSVMFAQGYFCARLVV